MVVLSDPEMVRSRAADLVRTSEEFLGAGWAAAAGGGQAPIDLAASGYRSLAQVRSHCLERGMAWWSMSSFSLDSSATDVLVDDDITSAPQTVNPQLVAVEPWHGDVEAAVKDLTARLDDGWTVLLCAEGEGMAKRMSELLGEHNVAARLVDDVDPDATEPCVQVIRLHQRHGFAAESVKLLVASTGDLAESQDPGGTGERRMPRRRRNQIQPLELKPGDLIVHEQHGVGRYVEMVQRTVGGATREYLVIEYAPSKKGQPGDRLFVPVNSLDQVTRYVGGDAPSLDRMGGGDWRKRKARARKAVREIAAELIKLYAARQATKGHAFGPDTAWQRELEGAFAYVETPDQLTTIADVKRDMEQVVPMDRLVCGDVGYGKTEIAVRAAFKAVQDGKQVAVLVPTTLLVQQHFQTFTERYAGFPVKVAALSRFQTDTEARETLEGLQRGTVDVVVGTHRLLAKEVEFKDLGLVIVDEEQRFGVEHKEALKRMRVNVDVLAMSATPIPRTLEMAVTGIREMSTIATPPEERHPVLTFAGPYDEGQVVAAIPLLVQQHFQTFTERYAGFPVKVAALSRFQTDTEARETLEGLQRGTVDVVVGTHRLLAKEVEFKDLGLVIVDEEQRFGVEHKEALKRMRVNVDVLAMSATPIPRTLEMAVTGIREMSTIATPPEERHPVLTFAGPYDEGQVVAAIRRELAREGQVFYIHNRVQSIEKTAAKLRELVPEARIVTAHGQMNEKQLEQIMVDFWERRADVLVCTTIVESGIDISTANTLLIDRADLMGLSQLHQLRGRVGRSRERGYAYFLYPADKPLSQTAHDRLATMAAHTDLGSGMAIAMKDLEIRGAGNLLGGEQSGHIADVGFDLYIRLVGDAVAEFRGDSTTADEPEMRIELPVDANLPVEYVETERLRLEMYKRLAEVRSDEEVDAIGAELVDRYGPMPEPVQALLGVARFRLLCRQAGIHEVVPAGRNIRFSPVNLPESRVMRLKRLYPGSVVKQTAGLVLVPKPMTATIGGQPLGGADLLKWSADLVTNVLAVDTPIGAGRPTEP